MREAFTKSINYTSKRRRCHHGAREQLTIQNTWNGMDKREIDGYVSNERDRDGRSHTTESSEEDGQAHDRYRWDLHDCREGCHPVAIQVPRRGRHANYWPLTVAGGVGEQHSFGSRAETTRLTFTSRWPARQTRQTPWITQTAIISTINSVIFGEGGTILWRLEGTLVVDRIKVTRNFVSSRERN